MDWLVEYRDIPEGVVIKSHPEFDGSSVGIMLSIWDVGYTGVQIDLKTMPPEFKYTVCPQEKVHPNRPISRTAKRAAARRRVKEAKEHVQASNLEDGLD